MKKKEREQGVGRESSRGESRGQKFRPDNCDPFDTWVILVIFER